MYKAIDRKTQNFHVMYKPGGPTIINLLDGDKELSYFSNYSAQTDFLHRIQGRELCDELLDAECRALVERQPHLYTPALQNLLRYKPVECKPKLLERLCSFFRKK